MILTLQVSYSRKFLLVRILAKSGNGFRIKFRLFLIACAHTRIATPPYLGHLYVHTY